MGEAIDANAHAAAHAGGSERPLTDRPVLVMTLTATEILSLAALVLPTWNVKLCEELSRLVEPYLVPLAIRSISARADWTSLSAAARDSVSWVPLLACTAR